jgi:Fe-S-cluster formation regulator IscX/YfhJ
LFLKMDFGFHLHRVATTHNSLCGQPLIHLLSCGEKPHSLKIEIQWMIDRHPHVDPHELPQKFAQLHEWITKLRRDAQMDPSLKACVRAITAFAPIKAPPTLGFAVSDIGVWSRRQGDCSAV